MFKKGVIVFEFRFVDGTVIGKEMLQELTDVAAAVANVRLFHCNEIRFFHSVEEQFPESGLQIDVFSKVAHILIVRAGVG